MPGRLIIDVLGQQQRLVLGRQFTQGSSYQGSQFLRLEYIRRHIRPGVNPIGSLAVEASPPVLSLLERGTRFLFAIVKSYLPLGDCPEPAPE